MSSSTLPAAPEAARRRAYVRYALVLVRTILARVADGESVVSICRDPGMPSRNTVARWAKRHPKIGAQLAAARLAAGRSGAGSGPLRRYCPVTAEEIIGRISTGETLTDICADPAMPCMLTVARWRRFQDDFDKGLNVAREAAAERLCDESLAVARAVTKETAFADHVKLTHFRWVTTARAPQLFGRVKPLEAPAQPRRIDMCIRNFKVETRPEDGWVRMVSYVADKASGGVVRDYAGDWAPPPAR